MMQNRMLFGLWLISVYRICEAQVYSTCTVPETTIIDQLIDRVAALEMQDNNNITDAILRLEEQLTELTNDIQRLFEERNDLLQTVERLQERLANIMEIQNASLARERTLHDGDWFTPFNGFQYRQTQSQQSWEASRRVCQELGGQLASAGIQNNDIRRRIAVSLSLENTWIGLTDRETEGQWIWIDGTISTNQNTEWFRGEPSNSRGDQHCGEIWGDDFDFTLNDDFCNKDQYALCERSLF